MVDQILFLFDLDQLIPLEGSIDVSIFIYYRGLAVFYITGKEKNLILKSERTFLMLDFHLYIAN